MRPVPKRTVIIGLLTGLIASAINTLFLKAAGLFQIRVENGGLLKLILNQFYLSEEVRHLCQSGLITVSFHIFTGLLMGLTYACFIHPLFLFPSWLKGIAFGTMIWLINGFGVLPLLHQGIFGHQILSSFALVWFFKANLLFGLILGTGNDRLAARCELSKRKTAHRLSSHPMKWLVLSLPTNNLSAVGTTNRTKSLRAK